MPVHGPAVALPLDELLNILRHLRDEQAHRDVSKGERQREAGGDYNEYEDQ